MSSNRPSPRRAAAPAQLTTQQKPTITITMEEWEAKAPLSDIETQSINALKAASERVPLPFKVFQLFHLDRIPIT